MLWGQGRDVGLRLGVLPVHYYNLHWLRLSMPVCLQDACDKALDPDEFVEDMKKKGIRVAGIGHRIKSKVLANALTMLLSSFPAGNPTSGGASLLHIRTGKTRLIGAMPSGC